MCYLYGRYLFEFVVFLFLLNVFNQFQEGNDICIFKPYCSLTLDSNVELYMLYCNKQQEIPSFS